MRPPYETARILIWGKTYPELSKKFYETVCTAGVREDGQPIRLYPIPFRYMDEKFHKYQWITARIARSEADPRPESYRIDCSSIELGEKIPTTRDEWGKRAAEMFKNPYWQFDSVEALSEAQRKARASLGVVRPREILKIEPVDRGREVEAEFRTKFQELKAKLAAQRAQMTLFEDTLPPELKRLAFVRHRLKVDWLCGSASCRGHGMHVLDWELGELQRKEGAAAALAKLREICNLKTHALQFFLGNMFLHPTAFLIVGLWYPKRADNLLFK